MNPSRPVSSLIVVVACAALALACIVAQAAPSGGPYEQGENAEMDNSPVMDESAAVDPEFNAMTSDVNDRSSDDDEAGPSSASSQSGADNQETQMGSDSNIADAKVQVSSQDMATAAGHHYHHHHSPSGKMEMGAHTEKKGAFGWHAKFPVGGKGRR